MRIVEKLQEALDGLQTRAPSEAAQAIQKCGRLSVGHVPYLKRCGSVTRGREARRGAERPSLLRNRFGGRVGEISEELDQDRSQVLALHDHVRESMLQ